MAGGTGHAAETRPARQEDLAALGEFFTGLSPATRYLRFFAPVTPTRAMLRRMSGGTSTGTADAVVAVAAGAIIGHAMAADRAGPRGGQVTEIGVVVADAWQGRGVGAALIRALITRARARGVTALAMDVLPGNRRVLAMIGSHWAAARTEESADCLAIRVPLPRLRRERGPAAPAHARPGSRPPARAAAPLPAA